MKIIRTAVGSTVSWGFISSLRKMGVEIIGVDCDPLSYAFYLLDNCYIIPKANDPNFMDVMLNICDIEEPDAIISGPEEELLVLARNVNLLGDVILLAPSYHYLEICTDKLKMDKFLRQIGIPTPERLDYGRLDLPRFIDKPRFGRGGKTMEIFENYTIEKNTFFRQEYIEGDEYSVDALADREGNTLNIIPRLRMKVVDGKSVRSKTVYDKEIIDYTKKIVKSLRLFGPSCIQCIKNDSGVYFIDVNPRFGGGSILSIVADPTILPNLIRLIKKEEPIVSTTFQENLIMLRFYREFYLREEDMKKYGV